MIAILILLTQRELIDPKMIKVTRELSTYEERI